MVSKRSAGGAILGSNVKRYVGEILTAQHVVYYVVYVLITIVIKAHWSSGIALELFWALMQSDM
jgi:hypothetical protein